MAKNIKSFVIPINVQALRIVGEDNNKLKGTSSDFSEIINGRQLGAQIDKALLETTSHLKNGIHLHWTIPAALSRGKENKDTNQLEFPVTPNRWLITRYFQEIPEQGNEPLPVKVYQWITQSNKISDNLPPAIKPRYRTAIPHLEPTSTNSMEKPILIPTILPEAGDLEHQTLGYIQPYTDDWEDVQIQSKENYVLDLHTASYYGPSFAAYYQNSASILGVYDDFNDVYPYENEPDLNSKKFRVSYQIIGWFSESDDYDILHKTLGDARKAYEKQGETGDKLQFFYDYAQQTLKWDLTLQQHTDTDAANDDWPSGVQSFYNGTVLDVIWEVQGLPTFPHFLPETVGKLPLDHIEVAIGNTTSEALSALIRKDLTSVTSAKNDPEPYPDVEKNIELLMNAFQNDLLRRLSGTDPSLQVAKIEEYLHSYRFSQRDGGSIWIVKLVTDDLDAKEVQLPLVAAELLALLNTAQQSYNRQIRAIEARQLQAYLDWTQWGLEVLESSSSDTSNEASKGQLKTVTNSDRRSYLQSEILQVFTQSGLSEHIKIETSTSGEVSEQKINYDPTYTTTNLAAESKILAFAEYQTKVALQYPALLNQLRTILLDAAAALADGDKKEALKLLKLVEKSNIQTDLEEIAALNQGNEVTDEITDVINNTNTNLGHLTAIAAIMTPTVTSTDFRNKIIEDPNPKSQLFNTTNLVDTQQIWLHVQACHYSLNDGFRGKANAVANALSTKTQSVSKNILPTFQNNKPKIAANLATLSGQISGIIADLQQLIKLLSSDSGNSVITTNSSSSPLDPAILLKALIRKVEGFQQDNSLRSALSVALQAMWSSLLKELPSGHQVILLVKVMQQAAIFVNPGNSVIRSNAVAYSVPNDPVIAITQNNVSSENADSLPLLPVNRNGRALDLPCRHLEDLVQTMEFDINDTTTIIGKDEVSQYLPVVNNKDINSEVVNQLLLEGWLQNPQTASWIVPLINKGEVSIEAIQDSINLLSNTLTKNQVNKLLPKVQQDLSVTVKGLTITAKGTQGYYINSKVQKESNPFLPLFLAWQGTFDTLELEPAKSGDNCYTPPDNGTAVPHHTFNEGIIGDNFYFDDNQVDLNYNQSATLQCSAAVPEPVVINGHIPLSSSTTANLLNQIRSYLITATGKDIAAGEITPSDLSNKFLKSLYDVYEHYKNKTILSQGLNGFNPSLMQQKQLLQLAINHIDDSDVTTTPLLNFLKSFWENAQWNKTTLGITTSNLFLPFRAGRFRLTHLIIVDAFGRHLDIGLDKLQKELIIASSLQPQEDLPLVPSCATSDVKPGDTYMAPRFVQPMRLAFNWLSATSEEGNQQPFTERTAPAAFSPITSWMMPNHLEDSLVIYDREGRPLGALGIEGSHQTQTWRSVPQANVTPDPSDNGRNQMLKDIQEAHPLLQKFLKGFAFPEGGQTAYQKLLQIIEQAQSQIHTPEMQSDRSLAVLMGQPFVLVQATLRLEMLGLPSVSLSLTNFDKAVNEFTASEGDYDVGTRCKANFPDIKVPVMLGDVAKLNDGLIGFFLGEEMKTFYTNYSKEASGAIQNPNLSDKDKLNKNVLQLLLNGSEEKPSSPTSKEITITMLMDPRTRVHATSGVLPMTSLGIPSAQYINTLHRLKLYFLANPVLIANQMLDIPLPQEKGFNWSWVQPGTEEIPLSPSYLNDKAHFDYSPQRLLDGWLKLEPNLEKK